MPNSSNIKPSYKKTFEYPHWDVFKNLMNFTWNPLKFHNCSHTNTYYLSMCPYTRLSLIVFSHLGLQYLILCYISMYFLWYLFSSYMQVCLMYTHTKSVEFVQAENLVGVLPSLSVIATSSWAFVSSTT